MRVRNKGIDTNSRPLTFTFDGTLYEGREGDTIASALTDLGLYSYRVTSNGENRGVFCGMGVCNECVVTIDKKEGVLACMTYLKNEMEIGTQNQLLENPTQLITSQNSPEELSELDLTPDLLVIGGGPAGMAAAAIASEAGLDVLLIDEREAMGGQYYKQPSTKFSINEKFLDKQYREGRSLISRIEISSVKILKGVNVWGVFDKNYILAYDASYRYTIRSGRILIATGAYEKGIPIPGWTLPGVMTTGAAQTLLRSYQVSPGRNVAISGNGPLNLQMAAELIRSGVNVSVIAETADLFKPINLFRGINLFCHSPTLALNGLSYLWTIMKSDTRFLKKSVISQIKGKKSVEQVSVSRITKEGNAKESSTMDFNVDAVALGFGFIPSNEIARILGCSHEIDSVGKYLKTLKNFTGKTTVDGIWIAGDSGGINGAQCAKSSGVVAGLSIITDLGIKPSHTIIKEGKKSLRLLKRSLRFQKTLWKIFDSPNLACQLSNSNTIICRCLSLQMQDIESDITQNVRTTGALKRITRVGMGKCQGRYCGPLVLQLLSQKSNVELDEFSSFAPQVPIKPVAIGLIAYPPFQERI